MNAEEAADAVTLRCLAQTVERLAHGVALLDASLQVRFVNAAALSAIRRTDFRLEGGRLQHREPQEESNWRAAIAEVTGKNLHRLIELHASRGQPAVFVSLSPVTAEGQTLVIATFERETLCTPLELQLFSSAHRLTLAENQVLQALCQGDRPGDIARRHGVSRSTVVTQVASIRSKTQRPSIQALLNTLSRLPALPAHRAFSMSGADRPT